MMGKRKGIKELLSPREAEILRHISYGETADAVARALGIGEGTVRTHLTRARKKLKAKSQAHAVVLAMRQRLI